MRKFLIAAAASASALVAAAPAAAQYYPAPPPPYGHAYGHGYQQNRVQHLIHRIDRIRYQIERLDRRDHLSEREARFLRNEALYLRDRVARRGYNGLTWRERRALDYRIDKLEQRVRLEVTDGNRRPGGRDGRYEHEWHDRDRDGRNDRYEDDRGRYPG